MSDTDANASIDEMWEKATEEINDIDPNKENWKTQSLPLARIKRIMKSEEGIYQEMERDRLIQSAKAAGQPIPPNLPSFRFMIAGEAPMLLGKACELLVKELTVRAWRHTERNRRRTLQRQDVHAAVGESEVYDFLIDIVPRITAQVAATAANAGTVAGGAEAQHVPQVPPPATTAQPPHQAQANLPMREMTLDPTGQMEQMQYLIQLQQAAAAAQHGHLPPSQQLQGTVGTAPTAPPTMVLQPPMAHTTYGAQPTHTQLPGTGTTESTSQTHQNHHQHSLPNPWGAPPPNAAPPGP